MTRYRVTDRADGTTAAEIDPAADPDPDAATSGERAIVLPAARPSTVRGRTAVEVIVAGWRFEFEVEDARLADLRGRATSASQAATHDGPTEVRAIIPGRVVSVAVVAGDAVTAGQRLLAVEAMKMENELRAPRDGTVERVAAAAGETVELGDLLVVIR
ncbi:MAG: acetyl-CoA carboxylase biotin carboxyl carrier protein subunit [Chloroflexota bacterium]